MQRRQPTTIIRFMRTDEIPVCTRVNGKSIHALAPSKREKGALLIVQPLGLKFEAHARERCTIHFALRDRQGRRGPRRAGAGLP